MENRNNAQEPLLQVRGLSLRFPVKQGLLDILMRRPQQAVTAVDDVDLAIYPGEYLGLVGESGCGKARWPKPSSASTTRTRAPYCWTAWILPR